MSLTLRQRIERAARGSCSFRGPVKRIIEKTKCCGRIEVFDCPKLGCEVYHTKCRSCKEFHSMTDLIVAREEQHAKCMETHKDIHKGQRGFILATGPSVRLQYINWLRDEIVLGVNFAHKITEPQGWVPTYTVTADAKIMRKVIDEYVDLDTKIVCSDTVVLKTKYKAPNLLTKRGISIYYRKDQFEWDCIAGVKIHKAYSTVGHLALPWAMWLGLNPIYLLGCDCTAEGHAYDDKGSVCPCAMTLWQQGFFPAMVAARREIEKAGRRIINATLGGNLNVLERIHFDDLCPKKYKRVMSKPMPQGPKLPPIHAIGKYAKVHIAPGKPTRRPLWSGNQDDYYELYKGQRGFILATGPSIAKQDIGWLKDEIVVGVNFAHKITLPQKWLPTFICTADHKLFRKVMDEYAQLPTEIVCSDTCLMFSPEYDGENLACHRGISLYYGKVFDWNMNDGIRTIKGTSSIGMMGLPWALWLGLNPIYMIGCDCTARGHAYDDKGAFSPRAMALWTEKFRPGMTKIRKILEVEGRYFYNATLGGNLEELERVDFDSLKPRRSRTRRDTTKARKRGREIVHVG